jgi:subtilisin family serine protease
MGWVYDHDIRLLNLSLGFSAANLALELATQRLYEDKGAIMVASAGNRTDGGSEEGDGDEECTEPPANEEGDGDEEDEEDVGGQTATVCDPSQVAVRHPARYPWVIAVGATDIDNAITAYSRLGAELDLVAPGGAVLSGQIRSTAPGGGYDDKSGTSQAAPHVTGALALALQQNPDLAFEDVLDVLAQSARNLGYEATKQGAGLLNVEDMIKYLRD